MTEIFKFYNNEQISEMKKVILLSIIMGCIILASCGPTAHIERANDVNFNNYHRFAWAQKDEKGSRSGLMEQQIKDAIAAELQRKGWQPVTRNPDVVLSYDVLVEKGKRVQSDPVYSWGGYRLFYNPYRRHFYRVYYPSQFVGYDNYSIPVKEGTITITMVDANNDETVLQGWASDEVSNRRLSSKEVNRIVKAIFKKWDNQMNK